MLESEKNQEFGNRPNSEVREITDIVGSHGPWQTKVFILAFLLSFPNVWHALVVTFLAPNMDHWCSRTSEYKNLTVSQWKNLTIPLNDNNGVKTYSTCKMYNITGITLSEGINRTIIPCDNWEYDKSDYASTIIDEWDLVCENDWLVSMSLSVYMSGYLVAVLVFGQLADRIGRRPVILICISITNIFGVLCAIAPNFLMFAAFRFFVALGVAGGLTTAFVLLIEVVGPEQRTYLGIGIQLGWATGYLILSGLAWFIRNWRFLQLAITLPCLLMVSYWWLLPESPRFLLIHCRYQEAEKELKKAMTMNKKDMLTLDFKFEQLCDLVQKQNKGNSSGSCVDLVRTPSLRKKSLNIFFNWFVNSFVYYGLCFFTNDLGGDPFLNFLIAAALEFPSYLFTMFVLKHLGRKKPLMISMILSGLGCFLSIFVPDDMPWLRVTVAMIGKFCITASFAIVYVFTAEIFPTIIRNIGVGLSSTFGRIGSIVAPFVKEIGTATTVHVPLGIFGGVAVLAGGLVYFLPETSNMPIPDTLEEAEEFGKHKAKDQEKLPLLQ
ncbi:organic cation transporter protein-like [Limulus polyphemus]|uniref:Organic cation transporter protein-like n=1 Tax=Limulus polyphemus TaxID=6850 RepID=A0ABM1S0C1_LIMPO|nr:organic cation transporter protein-like [Limulus polyphemus]